MQNRERNAVQNEALIPAGDVPPDGIGSELIEKGIVERIGHPLARLEHQLGVEPIQHAGNAAEMVGMCVGNDDDRQLPGSLTGQKWSHHPAAGIALAAPRARVDQDPTPTRRPQHRTISLADVEKM